MELMDEDKFPLLSLPIEIIFRIYIHLDYATRRALRVNGKLAEIEKQTKYQCEKLGVYDNLNGVSILFNEIEVRIPHSEVEKELEMMRENTTFNKVVFVNTRLVDRRSLHAICLIKAEQIVIQSLHLSDGDLEFLVKSIKKVSVAWPAKVTANGIVRICEMIRQSHISGKQVIGHLESVNLLWDIMDKFGTFNRETLQFTTTNPSQVVHHFDDNGEKSVIIIENNLKILFYRIDGNSEKYMPSIPAALYPLFPGTYHLAAIDNKYRREYARIDTKQD